MWLIILLVLSFFQSNILEGQISDSDENEVKATISSTYQKKVVDGIITESIAIEFKFKIAKISPDIENGLSFIAPILLQAPNVRSALGELDKDKKEFILIIHIIIFPGDDPEICLKGLLQEITNEFKEIFGENITIEDVKLPEEEKKEV